MLKKLEQQDAFALYHLLTDTTMRYVRYRGQTLAEYEQIVTQLIEKERANDVIVRVIMNEANEPIGQIALFDIDERTGFLSTWISPPYQGKGFNQRAKHLFLTELFDEKAFDTVYAKIRKSNEQSQKAFAKLPYMQPINETNSSLYQRINSTEELYDLFEITSAQFKQNNISQK